MKQRLWLLLLLMSSPVFAADLPSKTDISLLQEVGRAQERGLNWLVKQQEKDGSWRHHPAITGLAVTAIYRSGKDLAAEPKDAAQRGLAYILTCVKPTGAIFGGGENDKYPNYSTAICMMALLASGDAKHTETIRHARKFLLDLQSDEGEGLTAADASYGGVGYGRRGRPDLSNSAWAYEALRLTDSLDTRAEDSPNKTGGLHWQKAIAFIERCQNLPSHNDQPWAKNATDTDLGGFAYMPGFSFVNEEEHQPQDGKSPLRSHGSISYAGLKSFIYAELHKDDPRVQAVMTWLGRNYTLDENPGMGKQGLYYYLHLMTKALTAYGADTFQTADGKVHDWRYDLLKKFVQLQRADGFWQNDNNRFWENDPVLVTSYSLLAIEIIQKRTYP